MWLTPGLYVLTVISHPSAPYWRNKDNVPMDALYSTTFTRARRSVVHCPFGLVV